MKCWVLAGGDFAAFKSQYPVRAVARIDLEEAKTQQIEATENPGGFP